MAQFDQLAKRPFKPELKAVVGFDKEVEAYFCLHAHAHSPNLQHSLAVSNHASLLPPGPSSLPMPCSPRSLSSPSPPCCHAAPSASLPTPHRPDSHAARPTQSARRAVQRGAVDYVCTQVMEALFECYPNKQVHLDDFVRIVSRSGHRPSFAQQLSFAHRSATRPDRAASDNCSRHVCHCAHSACSSVAHAH